MSLSNDFVKGVIAGGALAAVGATVYHLVGGCTPSKPADSPGAAAAGAAAGAAGGGGDRPKVTIAYWNIRGLQQPVRYLCEFLNIDHDDVRYQAKTNADGSSDRTEWTSVKETLGLDFPNLPYMIHGDLKLTQSNTILKHLCRLSPAGQALLGATPEAQATIDMLMDQLMDLRNAIIRCAYGTYPDGLPALKTTAESMLGRFEAFIGKSRGPYLYGASPVLPDFVLFELGEQLTVMIDGIMAAYPKVAAQLKAFEALPTVKAHRSTAGFQSTPINNPSAKFGGSVLAADRS